VKVQAIIPTAGCGTRLKSRVPKPFVLIQGKPLICYTLAAFESNAGIDSIVLVGQKERINDLKKIVKEYKVGKVKRIVAGGKTRNESVENGLKEIDKDTAIVVIHDGARPFISQKEINGSIALCKKYEAVIVAVPVKPTIKRVDEKTLTVEATLQRDKLWEVQTPQVFKKEIIVKAHKMNKCDNPTDDSLLVEQMGIKVKVLMGSYSNIKITTKEDLNIAEKILCNIK